MKDNPIKLLEDIRKEMFSILKKHKVKIDESYSLQLSLKCLEDILREDN